MVDGSNATISNNGILNLTAKNYILNRGYIISDNELTLKTTSQNTNNPISTTFNQNSNLQTYINSLLTINNVNSKGIFNYGQIASKNNTTLESNSSIINEGNSLVFSNKDININAKDYFINYAGAFGTGIWANKDINIETNNTLANLGGNIESYSGNIDIDTNNLINSRISIPEQITVLNYDYKVDGKYWHSLRTHYIEGQMTPQANITSGNNIIIFSQIMI